MKKELLLAFAAFFFMSLTALSGVNAGESDKKNVTISEDKVDVTGDGKKDLVYVKGVPYEEGVQFLKEIYLKIKASNGKVYKIELEGGYDPETDYLDFNHDGVKDIFVGIPTGGSGGLSNYHLYTLKDFNLADLSVPEPLAISGQFEDDYRATISILATGQSYSFDLSNRKEEYDEMGLYKDGKLNEPTELMVHPYGLLKPTKIKGISYGLTGSQRVSGAYNADGLATVESDWYYDNGKWNLINTRVLSLGANN